mmetsp:Transcript_46342/g.116702  ORF Transcript_46342/g.116702 Transcript_46342/m.116702 type:complete len:237 (-) Transcript_46342:528-1238(-)
MRGPQHPNHARHSKHGEQECEHVRGRKQSIGAEPRDKRCRAGRHRLQQGVVAAFLHRLLYRAPLFRGSEQRGVYVTSCGDCVLRRRAVVLGMLAVAGGLVQFVQQSLDLLLQTWYQPCLFPGRSPIKGLGVNVLATLQQQGDHGGRILGSTDRMMEHGLPALAAVVRLCASFQQKADSFHRATHNGVGERGIAVQIAVIHVSVVHIDQQTKHQQRRIGIGHHVAQWRDTLVSDQMH